MSLLAATSQASEKSSDRGSQPQIASEDKSSRPASASENVLPMPTLNTENTPSSCCMEEETDVLLSTSPRHMEKYQPDSQNLKELNKVNRKQQLEAIFNIIYTETVREKPKNVLDFIIDNLFVPNGPIDKLK